MSKQDKRRPVADTPEIGKARYLQIRDAMSQYNRAMKEGFFIEAIALMESAISDRMESLLNYMFPTENYSYGTVGYLADSLLSHKDFLSVPIVSILKRAKSWAIGRNNAIHQMVKLLPNDNTSFDERYKSLEACAKDGRDIFNKLNNEIKKIRTFQDNHKLVFRLKNVEHNVINYPETLVIKCKCADINSYENSKLVDSTTYFEDINGVLWKKQLIDLYYDYVPEEKNK